MGLGAGETETMNFWRACRMHASVKVMRSYDYCHFEVSLSIDDAATDADVDELRKRAARLVDKAVRQYVLAKDAEGSKYRRTQEWDAVRRECENIEKFAENDRTPCDGKSETIAECVEFVNANRGWWLGVQAHKQWGCL